MRGLINIQISDANTGEHIDSIEQSNIITDHFVRNIFQNNTLNNLYIYISNAVYKPSLYPTKNIPDNTTLGFNKTTSTTEIPGVPRIQFVDKTLTSEAYLQVGLRFSPPNAGTTRNIKTVALTNDFRNNYFLYAYSELATPCTQTDSQIYDIYYRIMFDYTESQGSLTESEYMEIIKRMCQTTVDVCTTTSNRWVTSVFPKLKQKLGDNFLDFSSSYLWTDTSFGGPRLGTNFDRNLNYSWLYETLTLNPGYQLDFNREVGNMFASIKNIPSIEAGNHLSKGVVNTNIFKTNTKIQNVFGFKADTTAPLAMPFLDVDNLAQGLGSIVTGGVWDNNKPPQAPGMYSKTLMPKRAIVYITGTGGVGVGTYKYTERTFIGSKNAPDNLSFNFNSIVEVHGITSYTGPYFPTASNRGLLGNISDGSFEAQQISASMSYDGTSVLIPKKNKVLLYSIAGSEYWFITGDFTNIHQLAVLDGVVWIACRDTGLYMVDPRVSLTATKVTVAGNITPNFNNCHGVAVGYNNTLWAVGNDAIAYFDGAVWTVFNSATSPAFGTNNDHYSRIEYLKIDKNSSNFEMLLVYRREYTSTKLGLWWSIGTPLTETGVLPDNNTYIGKPKINRADLGGIDGYWFLTTNGGWLYHCAFGADTFVNKIESNLHRDSSVNFINKDGINYAYSPRSDSHGLGGGWSFYGIEDNFLLPNGTIAHTTANSKESVIVRLPGGVSTRETRTVVSTPAVNGYSGYYDSRCSILLDDGIMFSISKYSQNNGQEVSAHIFQIGLENNLHGGPFREITRKNYGWNGTSWELNHTGSKTIHSGQEELLNGVTIGFADGTTGTSFVQGNMYAFGLYDGLLKDNATRAKVTIPVFFTQTKTGVAELTNSTVPNSVNGPIGTVGMHPTWKSKDAFLDSANENRVTFPGNTVGEFAIGDKYLTGDFEISIPCTHLNNPLTNRITCVGIGDPHVSGNPSLEIWFYETTARVRFFRRPFFFDQDTHLLDMNSLTVNDTVGIKRVGNSFIITKNGNNHTTLTMTDDKFISLTKKKRLQIHHAKNWPDVVNYSPSNSFCPLINIVSNSSDNVVMIGNEVSGTEHFDLNCKGVTEYAPISAKLNGVSAIVKIDGSAVVPGEVGVDLEGLYLYFNPADVGKTIEFECTRYWNK